MRCGHYLFFVDLDVDTNLIMFQVGDYPEQDPFEVDEI
jgi:hypothetical protein